VDVDAVGELLDLRTEILRTSGPDEHARGKNSQRTSRLCFHGFVSLRYGELSCNYVAPRFTGPAASLTKLSPFLRFVILRQAMGRQTIFGMALLSPIGSPLRHELLARARRDARRVTSARIR
jgi:hypothetical protein